MQRAFNSQKPKDAKHTKYAYLKITKIYGHHFFKNLKFTNLKGCQIYSFKSYSLQNKKILQINNCSVLNLSFLFDQGFLNKQQNTLLNPLKKFYLILTFLIFYNCIMFASSNKKPGHNKTVDQSLKTQNTCKYLSNLYCLNMRKKVKSCYNWDHLLQPPKSFF